MLSGNFGVFPLFLKRQCILLRCYAFSTASPYNDFNKSAHSPKKELSLEEEAAARSEAYRQLENLNFKSAAKILFTTPPKRKKFGLDFHLVQLFFACLPSLAVYLVAQYARSEIRRMEKEVEEKKKQAEEENKVTYAELESTKENSSNDLSEVNIRLNALEAALKEILTKKINVNHTEPSSDKKDRNGALEPADKNSKNQTEAK